MRTVYPHVRQLETRRGEVQREIEAIRANRPPRRRLLRRGARPGS
jgi:hypothetical protein